MCEWHTSFALWQSDIQFGNAKFSCLSATASFLYIFNDHCQLFKVQVIISSHVSWYLWHCRMFLTDRVTLYSPAHKSAGLSYNSVPFLDLATDERHHYNTVILPTLQTTYCVLLIMWTHLFQHGIFWVCKCKITLICSCVKARKNIILYFDEYNNFCSQYVFSQTHGYMEDPLTATDHSAGEAQRCLDMVI